MHGVVKWALSAYLSNPCHYHPQKTQIYQGFQPKYLLKRLCVKHIREKGFGNLGFSKIELIAMVNAARRRDRLDELDKAVEA